MLLRLVEEAIMFLESRSCDARSNRVMSVQSCSEGIFALAVGHGKSPWFPRLSVLRLFGVDWRALFSCVVDGGVFLV